MKAIFYSLIFAVIVIYTKPVSACEVFNSSYQEWDEIPTVSICEASFEALQRQNYIEQEELDFVDLVIEIQHIDSNFMQLYIQVWDGDFLKFSIEATEFFDDQQEWVLIRSNPL
jgi:hypothetical protein